MTIGIAVLCENGGCAVLASDMRVTYGKTKIEPHEFAGKQYDFPPFNFAGAFAGSPSSTHAIFSELSAQLRDLLKRLAAKERPAATHIYFEHVRNAVENARKRELRRLQACAMESDLGVSINDWITGQLASGQPFTKYALQEGLRVLRRVKQEIKAQIVIAGFLREEPLLLRGNGAEPLEEAASPAIQVIGSGSIPAMEVPIARHQNVEMGLARTLLHVFEALNAARNDIGVGNAAAYVVMRPRSAPTPNGMLRFNANHPLLGGWCRRYSSCDTEPLESRTANDLVNSGLFAHRTRKIDWLGSRSLMSEL